MSNDTQHLDCVVAFPRPSLLALGTPGHLMAGSDVQRTHRLVLVTDRQTRGVTTFTPALRPYTPPTPPTLVSIPNPNANPVRASLKAGQGENWYSPPKRAARGSLATMPSSSEPAPPMRTLKNKVVLPDRTPPRSSTYPPPLLTTARYVDIYAASPGAPPASLFAVPRTLRLLPGAHAMAALAALPKAPHTLVLWRAPTRARRLVVPMRNGVARLVICLPSGGGEVRGVEDVKWEGRGREGARGVPVIREGMGEVLGEVLVEEPSSVDAAAALAETQARLTGGLQRSNTFGSLQACNARQPVAAVDRSGIPYERSDTQLSVPSSSSHAGRNADGANRISRSSSDSHPFLAAPTHGPVLAATSENMVNTPARASSLALSQQLGKKLRNVRGPPPPTKPVPSLPTAEAPRVPPPAYLPASIVAFPSVEPIDTPSAERPMSTVSFKSSDWTMITPPTRAVAPLTPPTHNTPLDTPSSSGHGHRTCWTPEIPVTSGKPKLGAPIGLATPPASPDVGTVKLNLNKPTPPRPVSVLAQVDIVLDPPGVPQSLNEIVLHLPPMGALIAPFEGGEVASRATTGVLSALARLVAPVPRVKVVVVLPEAKAAARVLPGSGGGDTQWEESPTRQTRRSTMPAKPKTKRSLGSATKVLMNRRPSTPTSPTPRSDTLGSPLASTPSSYHTARQSPVSRKGSPLSGRACTSPEAEEAPVLSVRDELVGLILAARGLSHGWLELEQVRAQVAVLEQHEYRGTVEEWEFGLETMQSYAE